MAYAQCVRCERMYSTSNLRDKSRVFICQDCAEYDLARMQKRRPRYVYGEGRMAKVIYERENA